MTLNIDNTRHIWGLMRKQNYEQLQPLLELVDNAIAEPVAATNINIVLNFDTNIGSVEDNGSGLPIDPDELARCLTYAAERPTDMNEHGCGLKAALAFMDPTNSQWRIVWKRDGQIYQISPPYGITINVKKIDVWPGIYQGLSGTIIEFPIAKEGFSTLYKTTSKDKSKIAYRELETKIKDELSQTWMFNSRVKNNMIRMHLNGEHIEPFHVEKISLCVSKFERYEATLDTGAKVEMLNYLISEHVPKSWFRKAMSANGYYIFKNGRIIKKINGGKLYEELYGGLPDNHHNGFIALINIEGTQEQCPHTATTKNDFPSSPLFHQLCKVIKAHIVQLGDKQASEASLVQQFMEMQRNSLGRHLKGAHRIEQNITLRLAADDGTVYTSPELDMLESVGDDVNIYEAKKFNLVRFPDIRQLYGNWVIACEAYPEDKRVNPILMVNADTLTMPAGIELQIRALAKNSKRGFPLQIVNFKGVVLFGTP